MTTRARVKATKEPKTKETLAFIEVRTVYSDQACNDLIRDGWQMLHAGATHVDANGYNAKPTFIMANPKRGKQ